MPHWREVYDHLGHAALYPPRGQAELAAWCYALDDELKMKSPYPASKEKATGACERLSAPIRAWLDTLPPEVTISGTQICEVFCPERFPRTSFKNAFLRYLYSCRVLGTFDGYWTATGLNAFRRPFINFHKRLEPL